MDNMTNVVVEIAGRDSIVALLEFLGEAKKEDKKYNFIFSIAYIPSEYDTKPEKNIFALGEILKMHTQRLGHTVSEMLYSAETGVWFKMIKPYFNEEFSTPCVGCLAYCHLCRLNLAIDNNASIITGERLYHDSGQKINQYREVLEFFDLYFSKHGVSFIRPVLTCVDSYIESTYEEFCTEYGFDVNRYAFAKCHLSGIIEITDENRDEIKEKVCKYLETLEEHMDSMLGEYTDDLLDKE